MKITQNMLIPMTRRYPDLPKSVLMRDAKIAKQLVEAFDVGHNPIKVLNIFLNKCGKLSPERYWELLRSVWIIAGSVGTADIFRQLMSSNRRSRYYFSTPEEEQKLKDMPETFEVYRATDNPDDNGLSWTLSKEYAEYYQRTYLKKQIVKKTVNKADVFAFIERNNESEILIL